MSAEIYDEVWYALLRAGERDLMHRFAQEFGPSVYSETELTPDMDAEFYNAVAMALIGAGTRDGLFAAEKLRSLYGASTRR